jgi:hypothetical protein
VFQIAGRQDDLVVVAEPRLPSCRRHRRTWRFRPYVNLFRSFKWAAGITQYVSRAHRIGEAAIRWVAGIGFIANGDQRSMMKETPCIVEAFEATADSPERQKPIVRRTPPLAMKII